MSKFKKGDWLLESDAEIGRDMLHHGYFIHDVLPNGSYVVQLDPCGFELWPEAYIDKCTVEPRCTGWDWVLPEPLIDGPGKYVNRSGKIVEIVRKVSSNLFPSHCWEDTQDMLYRPDGTYNVSDQPCPRDVVAKYVEPTSNRFGLKVGDTVTIKTHDGKFFSTVKGSYQISAIDDTFYSDGIARFSLEGLKGGTWHPYWFGLCQTDGSPLPEKPATKNVVLEEWCSFNGTHAHISWKIAGYDHPSELWFKTGVTRELEVPNEE